MIEINKYHVGDSRELLLSVKDESVDLVYMDPPYATGRNFGDFCSGFRLSGCGVEVQQSSVKT